MRLPLRTKSAPKMKTKRQSSAPGYRRDRVALLFALVTFIGLGLAFVIPKGTQFLMPGPLVSGHGAIEACSACHTSSGTGKLSWIHGLVAGNPLADSKACLTCHKMADTALNAHGASTEILMESTKRLTKVAASIPPPQSARAQSFAFPTDDVAAGGLHCATCHQEHQGANFQLNRVTSEQCRSCHVVKFDSFDGSHPEFENYPFKKRTQIIYDHSSHFDKHYPEMAKKDPAKSVPANCSTCHNSANDKRVMTVAPFEQTCSTCHLDQIVGKERVSGPKGIAFLTLPSLDLQTLKKKKAVVGEWPDASEASLTPFMKVLMSRNERGRTLIKTIEGLNLQELGGANDQQIKAVTSLVWEIKGLFYALIKGKATDVLAELDFGGQGKLSAARISDLIASIPQDVINSAHQQWLPNLGREMANRPGPSEQERGGWVTMTLKSKLAFGDEAASNTKSDLPVSESTPAPVATKPEAAARKSSAGSEKSANDEPPRAEAADQTDDLLFPTEEELRAAKGGSKDTKSAAQSKGAAGKTGAPTSKPDSTAVAVAVFKSDTNSLDSQTRAAAVNSIESDLDPESWAVYGGWYRQDYGIFYRPVGHKDIFISSWLKLTGPQAPKGDASPAAAVFDFLTHKDAQGSCTKCHSVDDRQGKGRAVNFSPLSVEHKKGRFTSFIHEPHFGQVKDRGCLTCHELEKGARYLKSYEQGDPLSFSSNLGEVKKDLCQTCHTSTKVRQDCLLCHKYHVNGVTAPITGTKNPAQ